jgi:hypothetical protein
MTRTWVTLGRPARRLRDAVAAADFVGVTGRVRFDGAGGVPPGWP